MTNLLLDKRPTILSPHVSENIDQALAAIRLHLDLDIAFVAEFLGTSRVFRNVHSCRPNIAFRVGLSVPMTQGYCEHVVAGRLPELIPDTAKNPLARSISETNALPIGSHISVPIRVAGGRVFGTLCCIGHKPRPDLDERDLRLMRMLSAVIASDLAADLKASAERLEKIERISTAMENGLPNIVFQPIVRLLDHAIVGVEALSRFNDDAGWAPDAWFAEAHKVGMGDVLELLAVSKTFSECSILSEPLDLNVNLSATSLCSPSIESVLRAFDPRHLVIEITEHEPVKDYASILSALAPLRAEGVRVAIDDAGEGYSSMKRVLALRPNILKFDVSLTRGIDKDPARQAMAAGLCEFARRTNTSIVAEGVETEGELVALKELKVENAQGYRFGRPQELAVLLTDEATKKMRNILTQGLRPNAAHSVDDTRRLA